MDSDGSDRVTLKGADRILQEYWRRDIAQVTGITPGSGSGVTPTAEIVLTAGNGLTGGGDLTASRRFDVGAGSGIVVNADSISLDYATPLITLGTAAAAGVSPQPIRADATIAAFDATLPTTQAIGDSAATGSAAYAARRDHKHAMPSFATPSVALGTAAAAGSAATLLRSDCTIAAFDATVPVTLTVSTISATGSAAYAARRDHAHAITSSSNPGAAASILASDSSGHLRLAGLGIGTAPVANGVQIADAGSFRWSDVELQRKAANVLALATGDSAQSGTFTSGVQGWQIAADGSAEFSNVRIRGELSSTTFKYSEITATAGTFGVFKSASTLVNDCTSVTSPTTFYVDAKKSDAGGALFAVGDVLRIKSWTGAAILDNWCTVSAVDNSPSGYTRYTVVKNSGTNGTFRAGTAVVNYGQSGQGYLLMTADESTAPYYDVRTHAGSPWSAETLRLRIGNLNGTYGVGANNYYGIGIGDSTAAGDYLAYDSVNGLRMQVGGGKYTFTVNGLTIYESGTSYLFRWFASGVEVGRDYLLTGSGTASRYHLLYQNGSSGGAFIWASYTGSAGNSGSAECFMTINPTMFQVILNGVTHIGLYPSGALFRVGTYYKVLNVSGSTTSSSWQTLATITLGTYTIVSVEVRLGGIQQNVAAQWCWLNVGVGRQGSGAVVTEAGSHHTDTSHFQIVASGNDALVQYKSDGTNLFQPKGVIIVGGGGNSTWDVT